MGNVTPRGQKKKKEYEGKEMATLMSLPFILAVPV